MKRENLSSRFTCVLAECLLSGYYSPSDTYRNVCIEMKIKGWLTEVENNRWILTELGTNLANKDRNTQKLVTVKHSINLSGL